MGSVLEQIEGLQLRELRQIPRQRVQLGDLAPHQLCPKPPVGGGAEPERPLQMLPVARQPLK